MARRSRNFDGCWTCRLRKIKCDATRPICLRCQKANLKCKGYDIVLAWADTSGVNGAGEMVSVPMSRGTTDDDREGLRRNVDLVKFPRSQQFERFDVLNKVVLQIDEEARDLSSGSYFEGPFGVFVSDNTYSVPNGQVLASDMRMTGSKKQKSQKYNQTNVNAVKYDRRVYNSTPFDSIPIIPGSVLQHSVSYDGIAPNYVSPHIHEDGMTHKYDDHAPVQNKESPRPSAHSRSPVGMDYQLTEEPETSIFSKTDNSYVHYGLLDSAKLTILAIKGPRFEFSEQSMFHILYPKFFPNVESDEWRPSSKVLQKYFDITGEGVVVKPLLTEFSTHLHSSLVSFVRVSTPNNPWNSWVMPLIKAVVFELVCEDYAKTGNFQSHFISREAEEVSRNLLIRNIKLAILCMALASSAFQKSLTNAKQHTNAVDTYHLDDDMHRSIELRKLGINILNYHLDEYDNNCEFPQNDGYDTYLMLALVMQVQLDNAYGVFENYELLFAIGDFILKRKPKHQNDHAEKYLRNVFHILNVFYESTQAINFFNFAISEKDHNLKYLDLNDNYDLTKGDSSDEKDESDGEYERRKDITVSARTDQSHPLSFTVHFSKKMGVEREASQPEKSSRPVITSTLNPIVPLPDDCSVYMSFGLPQSLIQLLHDVTQLANHKNVFRNKGVAPRNFPHLCAEIEDRIANWSVERYWKLYNTEYSPISNTVGKVFISRFHEALYYNVIAFHNALVVYYKRLIPTVLIESYQDYIEASFHAMGQLLGLNETFHNSISFSPSFWPVLICGCDIDVPRRIDLQKQCQDLWEFPCFTKYNYWRSKQILYEIWNRRTTENENNGFMDMIREWDIVLCLG